jgi:D-alanyl-D-alanine carboxypeptidase/Dockerin type I domain/Thrombospondin type 3 repeat
VSTSSFSNLFVNWRGSRDRVAAAAAATAATATLLALSACGGGGADTGAETQAAAADEVRVQRSSTLARADTAATVAADSDRDGVPDSADNCINVSNPDQRDTDADGIGNACDADLDNNGRVDFADLGRLRQAFLSAPGAPNFNPHADFNGDGLINFADLAVLRAGIFQPPGPAGQDAGPDPEGGRVSLSLTGSSQPVCAASQSHVLQLNWQLSPAGANNQLQFSVLGPDGEVQTRNASSASGGITVALASARGGPATVVARANAGGDNTARQSLTLALAPCVGSPAPQPPDLGFMPAPAVEPPIIGAPGGVPNEVDVVHLGGSPGGPTAAKLVAAVGTGAGVKLFSFGQQDGQPPDLLAQTEPFAGRDVKLHTLSPRLSPKLAVAPFVAGVRRDDHNLWLSSWQVFGDGSFQRFGTRGYGANAAVQVQAYAIAHRVLSSGNFQVVTALRHTPGGTAGQPGTEPRMRLVTWEVSRDDGVVNGRADSGDWGLPDDHTEFTVRHLNDELYVVHYRRADGKLGVHYWRVPASGVPVDAFGSASGMDHFGAATQVQNVDGVIALPIATDDVVAPLLDGAGVFKVITWETRLLGWGEGGLSYRPYFMASSDEDDASLELGVSMLPPVLTDARDKDTNAFLAFVRGRLTDGRLEQSFGIGQGMLFDEMPANEPATVHMASVTKNMVLLLAVEAIGRGEASLGDLVTVSEAAATIGGSQIGPTKGITTDDLQTGEVQTLETLLHGMMLRSGNDAAAAIAEHLAGAGNFPAFVASMNARAQELGLTQTLYGETRPPTEAGAPAGGGLSTPQDQITLLRFGVQLPLFAQIATARQYDGCGTTAQGAPRCYFLVKFGDSGYPGLGSWKGGNGGFEIDPDFNAYSQNGGPYCLGSGCLAAQATRMDRPMFVGLQQSGSRWGDADRLFSYGYRLQYTPDRRGSPETVAETVEDFALDNVSDTLGITVDIRDNSGQFQVCAWQTMADGGHIDAAGCRRVLLSGVAGSAEVAPRSLLDGTRISTLLADGDYLVGRRSFGNLQLSLWRVGTREQ